MNRFSFLAAWALVASPWVLLAQGNSCKNVASTTPDYSCWNGTNCLDYLEPAPIGIDARYAWRFPGGRGAGIKVFDVTGSYRFSHEDLPAPFFPLNPSLPPADYEHETGAVGIIVACDNGYGVTGIANQAQIGFQRPLDKRADDDERDLFSRGISNAVSMLNPGDVIWISGDMSGAPTNDAATAVCAHKNYGHVPIEWEQWEFDAISAATRKGIIFCEAAGNGEMNLDDDRYEGKFDRSARDSGAIIVGAGQSPRFGFTRRYDPDCLLLPLVERAPHYWCGYGTRVDVQGRGDSITTTGIGSNVLPTGWAANSNELYTAGYGGTSGATPMVAGAVACIQGFLKAQGRPVLTPVEMRDLLVATGIPQQQADVTGDGVVDVRHIGPLPNLRAAINALLPTSLAAGHFNNDSYEDLAIGVWARYGCADRDLLPGYILAFYGKGLIGLESTDFATFPGLASPGPVRITSIRRQGNLVTLRWDCDHGRYQLQKKASLVANWVDVGNPVSGNFIALTVTDAVAFYQIVSLPLFE